VLKRAGDEAPEELRAVEVAEIKVASPCIGVCRIDPLTKLCEGCFRTGEEIGLWRDADDSWRRSLLERIARRRAETESGTASLGKTPPNRLIGPDGSISRK